MNALFSLLDEAQQGQPSGLKRNFRLIWGWRAGWGKAPVTPIRGATFLHLQTFPPSLWAPSTKCSLMKHLCPEIA